MGLTKKKMTTKSTIQFFDDYQQAMGATNFGWKIFLSFIFITAVAKIYTHYVSVLGFAPLEGIGAYFDLFLAYAKG